MTWYDRTEMDASFKRCSGCGEEWDSLEDFGLDPALELLGYQPHIGFQTLGFFLFNHSCGTTIAIPAEAFAELGLTPMFRSAKETRSLCAQCFRHQTENSGCLGECECAYVNQVLDAIRERFALLPKNSE